MNKRVLIIAEIGVNHNGDFDRAVEMVHRAAETGVDVVKFQTGITEMVISKFAKMAQYQIANTKEEESQADMVRKVSLPLESYAKLKEVVEADGMEFMSTPFELTSVALLDSLDVKRMKIPSGEITNLPYLIAVAKTKRPVILSTGMSTLEDVAYAIDVLRQYGTEDLTLLQCNTEYPTPYEDANVRAMVKLREKFALPVGYSDHTVGNIVPIMAVALGAVVIEKHVTLDRNLPGPDHLASITFPELKKLVEDIRIAEKALGSGEKEVSASERKNMEIARKSLVALRPIRKGEILSEENLTTKRPGNGVSPTRWFEALGTAAIRDFVEDELIEL